MHSSFAHAVQVNVGDAWWYVPHIVPELPANKMLLSCMSLDTSWVAIGVKIWHQLKDFTNSLRCQPTLHLMVSATAANHYDANAAIGLHIMHIDLSLLLYRLLNNETANSAKPREPASKLTQQWFSADHCTAPQKPRSHSVFSTKLLCSAETRAFSGHKSQTPSHT